MKIISLQEFITPTIYLELESRDKTFKRYELGNSTLNFRSRIIQKYRTETEKDGWTTFVTLVMNNDVYACYYAIFLLIKDKKDFPNYEEFEKFVEGHKVDVSILQEALTSILVNGDPVIKKKMKIQLWIKRMIIILFVGFPYFILFL